MHFDNRKRVMTLNTRRYIVILVCFVVFVIINFSGWFRKPVMGIKKETYILIELFIYIFYVLYTYLMNYNYIFFTDDSGKFTFKFVSLRPFDNKKKLIEIHKKDFDNSSFKKSFFNLKTDLTLYANTANGVVSYPSISLSALSKEQIQILKKTLQNNK